MELGGPYPRWWVSCVSRGNADPPSGAPGGAGAWQPGAWEGQWPARRGGAGTQAEGCGVLGICTDVTRLWAESLTLPTPDFLSPASKS